MDTNIQHTKKQEIKLDKPKILYVEDDIISLDYITLVLKSAYEIDTAFKVKTALELVYKNKYDLLLLDINLGRGIDGVELMQQIRQIDFYKNIPIVAVTAYAAEADKPVSYTHLRAHETVLDLVCRLLLEKKKPTDKHTLL